MREAEYSSRQVACQLGCSACVVRRCWDQWFPVMSFTRRPGSGRPRQTNRKDGHHVVAPSLGAPCQTIRRYLATGHLGSWHPLNVLLLSPTPRRLRLKWCRAPGNWTATEWNQVIFIDESRSISAVMTPS
ncbi:transposable element Tcb2 transposase [Trichonephila clavipes]|uniref:Transposable element Tcb2 transposase n=1 Tax=Trichonephila clavipes TaxID=2585209 RepID=A0A8X6RAU4_TRICX|nr:transposable element Tcb2 transposase [Trichonephila clavipes]